MIKKILKATLLTALAVSSVGASEWRAPFTNEHGPLRYDLYRKKNKWTLDFFSSMHYRTANKAFLKHGTDTKPLSALIFGKEEFTISEAFEDANDSKHYFENRSPYLSVSKVRPKISYTEYGATLGGRFEYPVFKNKGRVGLRARVPFRTIRMEKDGDAEAAAEVGLQDAVIKGDAVRLVDGTATGAVPKVFEDISRYKLKLLYNMKRIADDGSITSVVGLRKGNPTDGTTAATTACGFNDKPYTLTAVQTEIDKYGAAGTEIPFVIIKGAESGEPPYNYPTAIQVAKAADTFAGTLDTIRYAKAGADGVFSVAGEKLNALPVDKGLEDGKAYVFVVGDKAGAGGVGIDYTKLPQNPDFDKMWVTTVHKGTDRKVLSPGDVAFIDNLLLAYRSDALEFLKVNGDFVFMTNQRTGLGDIDLDAFYEHTFNDEWRGEVWLGVRFPTGGSDKMHSNPYTVQLGNSNHWEIKLGANVGWGALEWLTLKADAYFSFVLEDTEKRLAVYKGSTIKNVGNCVDADVDWAYFVGRIDATMYHRKTDDLAFTLGYEIYYKTEDNVNFKCKETTDHFLGKVWTGVNGEPADATNKGVKWADYPMPLDNNLAEKNTEQVAHRLRFESNWHAHKYMDLYAGGAYTFAGQNMPREADFHCGTKVRF